MKNGVFNKKGAAIKMTYPWLFNGINRCTVAMEKKLQLFLTVSAFFRL